LEPQKIQAFGVSFQHIFVLLECVYIQDNILNEIEDSHTKGAGLKPAKAPSTVTFVEMAHFKAPNL